MSLSPPRTSQYVPDCAKQSKSLVQVVVCVVVVVFDDCEADDEGDRDDCGCSHWVSPLLTVLAIALVKVTTLEFWRLAKSSDGADSASIGFWVG